MALSKIMFFPLQDGCNSYRTWPRRIPKLNHYDVTLLKLCSEILGYFDADNIETWKC